MKIDISNLMDQVKTLQSEFESSKKNTEKLTAVGDSGAGMVKVTINGGNKVLSIEIASELINVEEKKMLEDLIVAAINNAYQQISEITMNEFGKLSSMLPNIPDLPSF